MADQTRNFLYAVCRVPLDYHNLSLGTANLAVARYRATDTAARIGTIFTNPGGPGGRSYIVYALVSRGPNSYDICLSVVSAIFIAPVLVSLLWSMVDLTLQVNATTLTLFHIYNIDEQISWDPRGINGTTYVLHPFVSCSA